MWSNVANEASWPKMTFYDLRAFKADHSFFFHHFPPKNRQPVKFPGVLCKVELKIRLRNMNLF